MKKLTQVLIPMDKEGLSKGNLIRMTNGHLGIPVYLGISVYDSCPIFYWKALQLIICDDVAEKKIGDIAIGRTQDMRDFDKNNSILTVNESNYSSIQEHWMKIIASYPHIHGTQDFTPYIEEYVRLNGECEVWYSLFQIDETQPQLKINGNDNYLFMLVEKNATKPVLTEENLGVYNMGLNDGAAINTEKSYPYLLCEKNQQIKRFEKLGINITGQLFEQMVNSAIWMLEHNEAIELLQKIEDLYDRHQGVNKQDSVINAISSTSILHHKVEELLTEYKQQKNENR